MLQQFFMAVKRLQANSALLRCRGRRTTSMLIAVMLCMAGASVCIAVTPAGTVIRNQASATYTDQNGQSVTVTSNIVETTIQQIAGINLSQDQQQRVSPGNVVRLSHRITNTGNGMDRYALQLSNLAGDSIDLSNLQVFADLDQNGIPDSSLVINNTPWMNADADFYVVIEGQVPATAADGNAALIRLSATSNFNSLVTTFNTDTVTSDTGAAVRFSKSINNSGGASPSGPYTVTLSYTNTGVDTAFDLTVIDSLPVGMSYVSGSARWSAVNVALSDADSLDQHSAGSSNIRYCAYDNSCTGLPEAQADPDASSINQVTAIVSVVGPGESGSVYFDVDIDALVDSDVLVNQAEMTFDSGGATVQRTFSNAVSFAILQNAGVIANGSDATAIDGMSEPVTLVAAAQTGRAVFRNIIWNTGNKTDTFNIELDRLNATFPAGTVYTLAGADAATPLLDTNSDGKADTGPLQPGAYVIVNNIVGLLPLSAGSNGGAGFDVTLSARSVTDATVFNPIINHLDQIVANQVDLTNQAPAGSSGALGTGPGPELMPVSTASTNAAWQANFDLYVRHQGSEPDTYLLTAHGDVAGGALPAGWKVSFTDAQTGVAISNTGALQSAQHRHVLATVTLPENTSPATTSVYFQAQSILSGAGDIKHDAVQTGVQQSLQFVPGLSAQLEPGGSVVYEHLITNIGNIALSDVEFSLQQSHPLWSAELYADTDQNGSWSPTDQLITAPISLLVGESKDVFIKVMAPANAQIGQQNMTTVSAQTASGAAFVALSDLSSISESHVAIAKEQAADTGCDGVPDPGTDFSGAQIEVAPGNNCVLYRLTATNNGSEPSFNVKIHDYTPPYTVYRPSASCSRNPCWMNEPALDETGTINAETDQLLPGDSFFLQFSVQVQ